jgi:SAM-dependent methyltransferase
MSDYFFDQAWAREKRRLDALAELYDGGTRHVLTKIGIGRGWRCLEIGAGTGTVARWMASQVGAEGSVLATDLDVRYLDSLGESRLEIRTHDLARDPLEEKQFDVIHARAVMQHVPAREIALKKLVSAVRPGGWLLLEDIVQPTATCYPELSGWSKILEAMSTGMRSVGADPCYGIKLHQVLSDEGLASIASEGRVPLMHTGTASIDFVALSVEQAADKLIASGTVTAAEIAAILEAFRTPGRTLTAATMISSWGRVGLDS